MITLTAKINLLSGDNKALSLNSNDLSGNNISSDLSAVKGVKKNGSNPFIIGASKIGDGAVFSGKVDYFIGNTLSDSNGNFATAYNLTVSSTQTLKSLTIAFDTANGRHPKSIFIDGVEYKDDDAIFTVTNLSGATSHTVAINNWNTPKHPIVITGVYVEVAIEIDQRNLISIERTIYDRSDLKLPSFGIISNAGHIEFNDINGEVRDYAEQLLLTSGLSCTISLNNTLSATSNTIGVFETDEWDYDNDNRIVSVSLKDDLEEWQDINVDGFGYDAKKAESKSLDIFYTYLWKLTSNRKVSSYQGKGNYNMLGLPELPNSTQEYLEGISINYPLLKKGSLWQQWTKLCQVAQAHIYKNSKGEIVFRIKGGN